MKVVIDTNVLASAIFWAGHPLRILEAWLDDKLEILISEEIYNEYSRVLAILARKYQKNIDSIIHLLKIKPTWVIPIKLRDQICKDQDDDKFITCAISGRCNTIISGDKLLLACTGYQGIDIISPRKFVDLYFNSIRWS